MGRGWSTENCAIATKKWKNVLENREEHGYNKGKNSEIGKTDRCNGDAADEHEDQLFRFDPYGFLF